MVAPSDKITLAYIGTGTQGLREMLPLLQLPEIQIVSVCDPCQYAVGLPRLVERWVAQLDPQGARKAGLESRKRRRDSRGAATPRKDIVETYYAKQRAAGKFKGCSAYADFREMLEKEKDLNAVKIMTPDHLHGVIAHRRDEERQARDRAQAASPTGCKRRGW